MIVARGRRRHAQRGFAGDAGDMRRQDHVVEREQRVVRGDRLGLEGVEPGAAEMPAAQRIDECRLVDDGPRAVLTSSAPGFISASSRRPISPRVSLGERAVQAQDVDARKQRVEIGLDLEAVGVAGARRSTTTCAPSAEARRAVLRPMLP